MVPDDQGSPTQGTANLKHGDGLGAHHLVATPIIPLARLVTVAGSGAARAFATGAWRVA